MPKINGLVYIAVGLFVSIMSYKLNYQKLIFFFYIGLLFVFVGVVKLIFGLIKRNVNKKESAQQKTQHQAKIKYCHRCGNAMRLDARFCTRCRARV